MTREEVAEIMNYCKEHKVTYKSRLEELNIPVWRFYDSKSRYAAVHESLDDIFVRLYGGIGTGCILFHMRYHVRCHPIWTVFCLCFNLLANCQQVKNRVMLSDFQ